ncbi:unnamed protein product [Didymodactylos carnosus]|uniref:Uncharacterized protein n=1 Tax=Didymodactylos carnosus TaxID=1234261 RepID=A0A814QNC3_9BILA|nr:unnamed protein product [Didymodactylos carnosus]CAF3886005.1 unnamed protein product [Didymodactylos carnosus]
MAKSHSQITSGSPFESDICFSRAIVDGPWIFVSGCTGYNYSTMKISDDVVEQAEQTFKNIEQVLDQAGSSFNDVVRVRYILTSRDDFKPCWPVMRKYLAKVKPAATMFIAAGLLDERMKFEVEVTAKKANVEHQA